MLGSIVISIVNTVLGGVHQARTSHSRTLTYRIALVCLGNICRSPMAHVVLEDRLAEAGLDDRVEVASSGTGDWHVGDPMDPRAAATLSAAGYDPTRHRARTFSPDWYAENDLILAMDASNYADIVDQAPTVEQAQQVRMFREFDPEAPTATSTCRTPSTAATTDSPRSSR